MKTASHHLITACCIGAASLATGALAADIHDSHGAAHHTHRHDAGAIVSASPAAHVHGEAELFIVQDGEHLEITLMAAAMDVIGFEGPQTTPAQEAIVKNAKHTLAQAEHVITVHGGRCSLQQGISDLHGLGGTADSQQSNSANHTAIESRFIYVCEQPQKLQAIEITLFEHFPEVAKVNAQWVVQGRQSAAMLSTKQRKIKF